MPVEPLDERWIQKHEQRLQDRIARALTETTLAIERGAAAELALSVEPWPEDELGKVTARLQEAHAKGEGTIAQRKAVAEQIVALSTKLFEIAPLPPGAERSTQAIVRDPLTQQIARTVTTKTIGRDE